MVSKMIILKVTSLNDISSKYESNKESPTTTISTSMIRKIIAMKALENIFLNNK